MTDFDSLQKLVELMLTHGLTELDLQDGDKSVALKRPGAQPAHAAVPAAMPIAVPGAVPVPAAPAPAAESLPTIDSPMVGTFYEAPNPDTPAFVKVGDTVGPDTVVCLIEAMKVFNEVKAEQAGVIAKVLVPNGDAVEFGQPLFTVRPS